VSISIQFMAGRRQPLKKSITQSSNVVSDLVLLSSFIHHSSSSSYQLRCLPALTFHLRHLC